MSGGDGVGRMGGWKGAMKYIQQVLVVAVRDRIAELALDVAGGYYGELAADHPLRKLLSRFEQADSVEVLERVCHDLLQYDGEIA